MLTPEIQTILDAWRRRARLNHQRSSDLLDACDLIESYAIALISANALIDEAKAALRFSNKLIGATARVGG